MHGRHPGAADGVPRRAADRRGAGAGQHDAQAQGHRRAGARQPRPPAGGSARSSSRSRPAVGGLPELADVVVADGSGALPEVAGTRVRDWDAFVAAGADFLERAAAPYPTVADSPAFWLYTSGTTGTPKGAMHRHGSLRDTAETYARDVLAIGPDDVTFSVAKFFFAYGLGNTLTFPFSVGASTVLDRSRPSPAGTLRVLREHRPTLFFGGPTYYAALLAAGLPAGRLRRRAGLRVGRRGLPRGTVRAVHRDVRRRDARRHRLDRDAAHLHQRPARPGPRRHHRRGRRRLRGQDRQDDDGQPGARRHPRPPVRARQLGGHRLLVPHRGHPPGLPGAVGAHRRHLRPQSADGYYASLGRTDDIIKAGGIWVSPTEVEERLRQHPDVNLVVVVSVPDADGLDKPVACVVLAPGLGHHGRRPRRLLPRGAGRVQAAPARPRVRRAADHRHRQAAALPRSASWPSSASRLSDPTSPHGGPA